VNPAHCDGNAASALPAPLERWAAELLAAAPPHERHATCSSCAMCAPPAAAPRRIRFAPQLRCCTYRPQLANHLAGRVLLDPARRGQLDVRLAAGEATPLGLRVATPYQLLYRHASAQSFGRAERLRCPHLQADGDCGIWGQRPAVCATWFCKHERGALGARLWASLRDCFAAAERLLALWCLDQLGFDGATQREAWAAYEQDQFDPTALDGEPAPDTTRRLWGDWQGREVEFYRSCAEIVAPLHWSAVERIGGSELASLAARAREAARAHDELALPAALGTGRFDVVGAHAGRLCLQTYSEFDPLEVSPDVLALAARCDGRSPEAISAEHAAATGRSPGRRLLRMLLDFGVLEAAAPARR